ncbi:signal peptidase I [Micromonospora saelicesensis]|uniref:Signal peptidase I n=1 Tax=Micromonospora saelicesensis TaxID=285676 RepID=A0A1C4X0P5_9ACTN|nr:signal peptidase I [Micromonospora saelicesensis]RAN92432.1 Signal peptidase I [Micromonospora saelicesensis]RAO42264.1 Signal peptidase I [Micromonospora saelicesensis]RAO54905.1 Signal peptidase I [Micromonospora saelicesensis]RAO59560.1 Signal peptidase I [Micromonospora saelicesensis]SCF01671.1 signal peptidase I [Micromonospora saelicesensis]
MIDEQTDKPRSSFWKELPILLGVAILVAVLVRAFVLQTFFIPSPSMENTLKIDDRVLVNKLVYDFRSPHRGEVIVFKAPTAWSGNPDGEDFIKRVIGIPGDHVVCCDPEERLMINGKSLDEPYIFSMDGIRDKPADQEFDITVPEGRLWVMGDHRSASGDSLEHWQQSQQNITEATIPEDDVVGRAFTVFWPVNRATWLTVPDGFDGIPKP